MTELGSGRFSPRRRRLIPLPELIESEIMGIFC
jgi:hypothetical protein